jgi:hypothetical protein
MAGRILDHDSRMKRMLAQKWNGKTGVNSLNMIVVLNLQIQCHITFAIV